MSVDVNIPEPMLEEMRVRAERRNITLAELITQTLIVDHELHRGWRTP